MTSAEGAGIWASASVLCTLFAAMTFAARRRGQRLRSRLGRPAQLSWPRPTLRSRSARSPLAVVQCLLGDGARRRRSERHLVEWIDGATRIVRSGGSLRQALVAGVGALSAPGDEFVRLGDDLTGGSPLDDALGRFEAMNPSPSAILAARCISLAGETGGRPARLLEGVSFTIRERLECSREARALATQARSSAVVIMAAPVVFAVVAAGVDRRVAVFLFGSIGGLACIAGGLLLEVAGCAWMARLVRNAA